MTRTIAITTIAIAALAALALARAPTAHAGNPDKLTVAMYAPSLELDSGTRLSYLIEVAQAIQAKTGVRTQARVFAKYSDLTAAKPDFAIIEAQCIAARAPGKVLATATVDGARTLDWGIFAAAKASSLLELRGKKLAFVKTGCRDSDFLDFAALLGVFRHDTFFASSVARVDAAAAVITTREIGDADAVVAPSRLAGGLEAVVRIEGVPNPGLVAMNDKLDAALLASAKSAVMGTSHGPITGWAEPADYAGLAGRMTGRKKALVLTEPKPVDVAEPGAIAPPRVELRPGPATALLWQPPAKRPRR